jgi:pimeloyl-ACP methyl ester carboxylesterase
VKKSLILLHGWGTTHQSLFPLIQLLQPHFQVYAPDLPYPTNQIITLEDYCQFVLDFVKNNKLYQPVLIGHSLGGAIATKIAADHPATVSKIVLLSAASVRHQLAPHLKFFQKFSKLLHPIRQPILRLFKLDASDYIVLKTDIEKKSFRNLLHADLTPLLSTITCPTLILWGNGDRSTPVSDGHLIHSLIPHSMFYSYPGGHFFYLDHPREVAQKITGFIDSET